MNPAYILLAFAAMAGGAAIAAGYFAFISMIGIFPKLLSKIQYNRHYMLVENLLAYGAALGNVIYIFTIKIPLTLFGFAILALFGGIFVGCLAGALTEVLNVFPIISRRFKIRKYLPYAIYALAAGKTAGSIVMVITTFM